MAAYIRKKLTKILRLGKKIERRKKCLYSGRVNCATLCVELVFGKGILA